MRRASLLFRRPARTIRLSVAGTIAALVMTTPAIGQEAEGSAPTAPGLQGADLSPLLDRAIFAGNPRYASGQLSPDGRHVSFVKPHNGVMNLWVADTGEPLEDARLLTAGVRAVSAYTCSRDGHYVLYRQDRGGSQNHHIHVIDPGDPQDGDGAPPARDLTPLDGIKPPCLQLPMPRPT